MKQSEHIVELDLIRGICIVGILLLHISAYFLSPNYNGLSSYKLSLVTNQVVRFTLPLFVFISGFVLAKHYHTGRAKEFYLKRIKKVLIPYLVWSAIYFCFALLVLNRIPINGGMQAANSLELNTLGLLKVFLFNLLFGWNYVHLYFVFLIIQFYLLFPAIYFWLASLERKRLFFWGITLGYLVYLIIVFSYRKYLNIPYLTFFYKYYWELAPSWFFYFFLGVLVAQNQEPFKAISVRYFRWFALLFWGSLALVVVEAWQSVGVDARSIGKLTSLRPTVFLNCLLAIFCIYPFGSWLMSTQNGISKVLQYLNKISFSLFFNHLIVLYLSSAFLMQLNARYFNYQQPLYLIVLSLVVIVISTGISALINHLPFAKYLGGK